jgi:gliding motility-associated-like protein
MTGQIGVPETDDRRELAIWRLDKNGNLLWGESYQTSIWSNPITGSSDITGIKEDAGGNIYLSGNLRIFEASKFAFAMKLDAKGNILWDQSYSSNAALAYGISLSQNKLFVFGNIGPLPISGSLNTNVIWCIQLNTVNGDMLSAKGWYADFGEESSSNSFAYANTSMSMLDNGQVSIQGTARSDFLGMFDLRVDTINHSIIANFSADFNFLNGIMISSRHASNYYNTVATQHSNGRISYTRFIEDNNLYGENIMYGSLLNNQVVKERVYHEPNRSSELASNFLYYSPDEDIVIQTYWDSVISKGGLEILRLQDKDSANLCNGKDTSLTFIQSYFMKAAPVTFDSILANTFQQTNHNSLGEDGGNLVISTACTMPGVNVHATPIISLDKDSVLCAGSTRNLTAGEGYSRYVWNNGSTDPSLNVSDTGKYWVSVTSQNGCTAADTAYISTFGSIPSHFLPRDTTICQFAKLTIQPAQAYQNYLWSDQSTGSTITVSQPGLYQLQVTDSNQCVGSDSLLLATKECLQGLFVPNAFTPNGDGLNDVFRPLLFGNITRYRFAVYNRWGEKVFETQTSGQGWDGKQNGVPLGNGAFVWYCQYQLDGQPETTKEGTVVLIH